MKDQVCDLCLLFDMIVLGPKIIREFEQNYSSDEAIISDRGKYYLLQS